MLLHSRVLMLGIYQSDFARKMTLKLTCVKSILFLLLAISTVPCAMTAAKSGEEDRPVIIEAAVPSYSQQALAARAAGEVVLELRISPNGLVKSVRGVSGEPILVGDSKRTAHLWKFAPVDKAIGTRKIQLTFVYRLVSKNTPFDQLTPVFKLPDRVEITHVIPEKEPPRLFSK